MRIFGLAVICLIPLTLSCSPAPAVFDLTPEETETTAAAWQHLQDADYEYRKAVAEVKIAHEIRDREQVDFSADFTQVRVVELAGIVKVGLRR